MRFLKFAVLAALFALPVSSANAGVLSSLLSLDGNLDLLVDDSASFVVDRADDADLLQVGDLLQGAFNLDVIDGNTVPSGSSIFGVFSFEVESITGGPTGQLVQFGAPTAAADSVLNIGGVDLSGIADASVTDTALLIIESDASSLNTNGLDASTLFTTDFNGFEAVIAAGFVDADDQQTVLAGPLVDVTDLTAPGLVNGTSIPVVVADFSTSLSVTGSTFGLFLPVPNPSPLSGGAFGDLIGTGTISTPTEALSENGFLFSDDGVFAINAVPEPTSVAIFGFIALCSFERRRRKSPVA